MSRTLAAAVITLFASSWSLDVFAADPTSGAAVFKAQCGICHAVQAGKNLVGPSLAGIVGRKSGTIEGFRYSAANKGATLTWDVATLDKYLTAPRQVVPGTSA